MANRRALIIAPLYDGKMFPQLAGRTLLVERLRKCLSTYGNYDVHSLDNLVDQPTFRKGIQEFFDSDGELFFYYYGHGCLRPPGLGIFATSDASPFNEGPLMSEVIGLAQASKAREVVLILDCCHAGAAEPITGYTLLTMASQVTSQDGRGFIAACAANQQGWETSNNDGHLLGAFSTHVLDGLEGAACGSRSQQVRASTLGAYVTDVFSDWKQDPVSRTSETGLRLCAITFFPSKAAPTISTRSEEKRALIVGLPFKHSQLFEGRTAEIDSLLTMFVDDQKSIVVSAAIEGLGGMGKTELVIQFLHHPDILRTYDIIIWLDSAGPLLSQWEKVAADLDMKMPNERPVDLIQRIERELRKRGNALIVLDNVGEWNSVHDLIPQGVPLLITTKTQGFGGNSFRHLELRPLSQEASVRFLLQMVPELKNDPTLTRLTEMLDGYALALELAGWNIKYQGLSAAEYIKYLTMHQGDSSHALSATRYKETVDGCLTLTWNALRLDSSRALWRRASLFAPISANRELLRTSFIGDQKTQRDIEWIRETSRIKDLGALMMHTPDEFNEAYAELRMLHVLSQDKGFNSERWTMHRLVRNYGRARLQSGEVMVHTMALAEWLRHPTSPLSPEIPHFVATVLDAVRQAGEFTVLNNSGYVPRETMVRGLSPRGKLSRRRGAPLFDPEAFIAFFESELQDPKALKLILEGLTDINEAVRIQAIELLESIGPISEVLDGLANSLADPDSRVRETARNTLAKYGSDKTINILRATIRSPNRQVGLEATRTLGLMSAKAHNALKDVLSNDDLFIRTEAALLLCEAGQKEGITVLIEAILSNPGKQSKNTVRAIHALGKTKEKDLYPNLLEVLKQDDDDIRCAAADAIEELEISSGPETIVNFLAKAASKKQLHGRFPYKVLEIAGRYNITIPEILYKYLL